MVYCEGIEDSRFCLKCDRKYCVLEEDIDYMRDQDEWEEHYKQTHSPDHIDYEERERYGFINHVYEMDMFYAGETEELNDALKEYQKQEIYYKRLISAIEKNTTISAKTYMRR